nr:GNAT family N-acetyltransferase [uncultured Caproiciproducens sp.]
MEKNIRLFIENDWDDVKKIYHQGINTNLATFRTTCPSYPEWNNSYYEICRYVCEQDGKVVGWAALSPVSSRCIYSGVAEINIYVINKLKHQGIGTLLLNRIVEMSEKNGIWSLQANIMQNNYSCILLYEKCGFRKVGYFDRIARDRFGTWRKTVLLEKRSDLDNFDCCCE